MTVTTRSKAHKSTATMTDSKATLKSIPIDVLILIIEILRLKEARRLCDALHVPEQVAAQYCYLDENDIYHMIHDFDLKPNSYKYLLKNKRFQTEADLDKKTMAALRTFDLEFLKNYIEEFKPNLNVALFLAASIGFTEAVKLLLSDSRVDLPSAWDNEALRNAAWRGHTEVVKLLLSDSRVDLSAWNNGDLRFAARNGHTEIVKLLLSDSRVDPSAESIEFFLRSTAREDVRKLLKSYLKKKQSKE